MDVHAQLGGRGAQGGQGGDGGDLARLQFQSRARADIPEGEFDQQAGEVRRNSVERCDKAGALLAIQPGEHRHAAFIAIVHGDLP
jgi:hypothetical protein